MIRFLIILGFTIQFDTNVASANQSLVDRLVNSGSLNGLVAQDQDSQNPYGNPNRYPNRHPNRRMVKPSDSEEKLPEPEPAPSDIWNNTK